MSKTKYYSLTNILKCNAQYNIIVGQRSNGKTYACLEYCIKRYFENGEEFALIRRWLDDFKGRRGNALFSSLENNSVIQKYSGGVWTNIVYRSMQFFLGRYEDGKLETSDKPIGYCFALSQMEHDKSTSYPNVVNIVFDEFLTRSEYGYLNNEFILFMNTLSTIMRDRGDKDNIKIYMLGNTVSFFSPYYAEMGLKNITKMKPGSIDVYEYGSSGLRVAVEYTETYKGSQNSNKFFAFDNPRLKMITGSDAGSWEIDIYPHLPYKYKPSQIIFTYFVKFDDLIMQCEIIQTENGLFTYVHRKTSDLRDPDHDIIFSIDVDPRPNWQRNILKCQHPKIRSMITSTFGKVFYQDNELGEYMRNYLIWCKQN